MFHADSGSYPRMFVSWVLPCPAYFEVSGETDDGDWRFYSSWKAHSLTGFKLLNIFFENCYTKQGTVQGEHTTNSPRANCLKRLE